VRGRCEAAFSFPNSAGQRTALVDSIPQWVLFKMPTVEPTPPINDPLTNAVQRSVHNRPVTDYRPYRLLSRIRHLGATE
jgi:hypothetical protein